MKTKAEIQAMMSLHKDDLFDFWVGTLAPYLDYADVENVLGPLTVKEEDWKVRPSDDESVREELVEYLEFAWEKVEDHRGLSANRSVVDRCSAWAWMLGGDELLKKIEETPFSQYGAPKLALICNELNISKPNTSGLIRMMEGLPCSDDCESGCGR